MTGARLGHLLATATRRITPRRTASRLAATSLLGLGILMVPLGGSPASAACSGSGATGWDVTQVAGDVYEYSLIAYYGSGCTVGVVDIESAAVPGTPGTCTLVLPVIPTVTDGTGCANLLGAGGVSYRTGSITSVTNGFVSDGTNTRTIAVVCSGSGGASRRC